MKIKIKLHPGSSQEKIFKISKKEYEVWLKERAMENRANKRLLKFLKKYFKANVEFVSGFNSKIKFFEIGL